MISLDCPPGYTLAQAPLESGYETCSCNYNNELVLDCDGRNILIEVNKTTDLPQYAFQGGSDIHRQVTGEH